MDSNHALDCLEERWQEYLVERGHYIYRRLPGSGLTRSRSSKKKRYLWLLAVCERGIYRLSKAEQTHIRRHVKEAAARKERVYLVVGFIREPKLIVILPADRGLEAKCVGSDKGGIAWND